MQARQYIVCVDRLSSVMHKIYVLSFTPFDDRSRGTWVASFPSKGHYSCLKDGSEAPHGSIQALSDLQHVCCLEV